MERRDRHYHYLNEQVFKPLSELKLEEPKLERKGYFVSLRFPKDAYLWESAVKHMMKGDSVRKGMPQFIDALEKKVTDHNRQAVDFTGSEGSIENQLENSQRISSGGFTLDDLEDDANSIEADVATVRSAFLPLSRAIEVDQYAVKADCCPTIRTILKQYWF